MPPSLRRARRRGKINEVGLLGRRKKVKRKWRSKKQNMQAQREFKDTGFGLLKRISKAYRRVAPTARSVMGGVSTIKAKSPSLPANGTVISAVTAISPAMHSQKATQIADMAIHTRIIACRVSPVATATPIFMIGSQPLAVLPRASVIPKRRSRFVIR
jgi:hypothetical protein